MLSRVQKNHTTGLSVDIYKSDNVYPLLPLLSEEFPEWTIDKIKNYVKLVVSKKDTIAGMLVVKNESLYNVGLLVYTFQSVDTNYLYANNKKKFAKGLVVENIVASSPILKQQIFLLIVEHAIDIAKKNNCKFIELPKFNETFKLIEKKYNKQIIKINSYRTAIDVS